MIYVSRTDLTETELISLRGAQPDRAEHSKIEMKKQQTKLKEKRPKLI